MWHAGRNQGIVALRLHSGQWWWRAAAVTTGYPYGWTRMSIPGSDVTECDSSVRRAPSAKDLLAQGFINAMLAHELSKHFEPTAAAIPVKLVLCDFRSNFVRSYDDAYDAIFSYKERYYYDWWLTLHGGAPADLAENSKNSAARPYYSFTLSAEPKPYYELPGHPTAPPLAAALTFRGATLDVWFPYVLRRNSSYSLDLAASGSDLRRVRGSLSDNVLHFSLPEFTWGMGYAARGTITGASL